MSYVIMNTAVDKAWIDYNGHMNAGYYNIVIDMGVEQLIVELGGHDYFRQTSGTFYTVETHIIYTSELKLGDPIHTTTQIVSYDRKRLHLFTTLYHGGKGGEKGYEAASGETMLLHYHQSEQAVLPMPDDFFTKVDKMGRLHAALPLPEGVGRAVRRVVG